LATTTPARNFYEVTFTEGLWWEQAVGGSIYPDSPFLVVAQEGDLVTGTEYARCALKFSTTAASWVALGDIAERHSVLWLYCNSMGKDSAAGLEVGAIDWAWTMATNQATMRATPGGGWSSTVTPAPLQGQGWVGIDLLAGAGTYLRNANGLVIRTHIPASPLGAVCYQFLKDPPPIGRAYFWYDVTDTVHGSATERLAVSAAQLAALETSRTFFSLSGSIIQSHRLPDESDVAVTLGRSSSLSLSKSAVNLPESWKMSQSDRGSLSLSRSEIDALDYRGSLFEVTLAQKIGQTGAASVAVQKSIIGSVEKGLNVQNVTLTDTLFEALSMSPYYRDEILGIESVNILTEPRLYAVLLILINGGAIPWERFRQEDLVWLLRRFGVVWDDITISSITMATYTVGSFVEEFGKQYGLCLSRGVDDSIVIWHPAAYRPSMKVWSVNDKDLSNIVYKKVNTIDKYSEIESDDITATWDSARTLALDGQDKGYDLTGLTGIFATASYEETTQYALARQLGQRLIAGHEEYRFSVGKRAIVWEVGDKLKITSTRNSLSSAVFTITSKDGDPYSGQHNIVAIRWPDSPGLQSTWEATDLQGIYRLAEWDTGAATGANQSPIGSAGALTVNTLNGLSYSDWRGPLANVDLTAPGTFFPSFSNYDLVDFAVGVFGRQSTDPYGGAGRDETYTVLMKCQDSTPSNKAVICGIKRIGHPSGSGTYWPTTDLRFFLGYTADYTADPIVFAASANYIETPPGLSTNSWKWIYGVALQWYDDKVRLYVDREYIGEITALGSLLTDVDFTTPVSTEHKIGCIRWLQNSTTWFDVSRLMGAVGLDNYYP